MNIFLKNQRHLCMFILTLILLFILTTTSAFCKLQNCREVWNSWTDYQKYIYLWGFNDSRENVWMDIADIVKEFEGSDNLTIYEFKRIIDLSNKITLTNINTTINDYGELNLTFNSTDLKVLRDVITDLYKDPANSYISFKNMIFFAMDKLNGKSIESRLAEERESIKKTEIKMQELLQE